MKFDYVIGNPPYQGENDDSNRKPPIYPDFMDSAYLVGEKVELITPARFLFNAGQTSKAWNEKMLTDKHLTVLLYEADGTAVFPDADIKGGVAVTLRDSTKELGPIGAFTPYLQLNRIAKKVREHADGIQSGFLKSIVSPRGNYRFNSSFTDDYPQILKKMGKGTGNMFGSNIFALVPECATTEEKTNTYQFLCRIDSKRSIRYVDRRYVLPNNFTDKYNVAIPQANGRGSYGEALSTPEILNRGECTTDTFLSIGQFDTPEEAQNLVKYIKGKFSRALLGIKKVTQNTPPSVWEYVPLQDFTNQSDIDWSKSIAEIDQQLYKKYRLDNDEIEFIESHVKEMN